MLIVIYNLYANIKVMKRLFGEFRPAEYPNHTVLANYPIYTHQCVKYAVLALFPLNSLVMTKDD